MQPNLPTIIVPARLASTRFPNKLLTELDEIPLILHTAKRLAEVAKEFEIIFAVDGEKLEKIWSKRVSSAYEQTPTYHPVQTESLRLI